MLIPHNHRHEIIILLMLWLIMYKLKLAGQNQGHVFNIRHGRAFTCFEKCKQLLEDQNFLLLGDIWWAKFYSPLKCC